MSEWKACLLKDLCDFISTKTSITNATLQNYVSTENMLPNFGGVVNADKLPSGNTINSFQRGDVLFSNIRTYFKKVWFAEFNGTVSADVLVVRAKSVCDPRFLYYLLCEPDFTEYTVLTSRGAKMPRGDKEAILSYKLDLPPLPEQKAIASVLSSLDDKIDLLHRQNKTLEAMAETLFRQWFIEEAKEGWPVKPLKEICQIINGFAFKSGSYTDSGYKVIRTLNFTNHKLDTNQLVYVSEDTAKEYEKYNLQRKDFLLVMVGASLGNYAIVTKDALPALQNQNMWCFRAFDDCYQNFLNHRLLDVIEENLSGASGSAREFFQKSVFYEVTIAVPPNELLEAYNVEADALFNKMELNRDQIQTLENLRDTLLPKLMSGEVRVQYQTEEVA
ncbi:restriction endonuclease subunit S [Acinetobacter baumannii]